MVPIDGHRFDVAPGLLLSPGTQRGVGGKTCRWTTTDTSGPTGARLARQCRVGVCFCGISAIKISKKRKKEDMGSTN